MLRTLCICLHLILACTCMARENFVFSHIKSDAGLPHQQVQSMAFDHDGMLWVGTRNGLAKYDGYSFVTYHFNNNDTASIDHNLVRSVFVDSKNNVWIGSDRGLCRYRRQTDDFQRYDVGKKFINHITETRDGSVIAGGDNIYRIASTDSKPIIVPRQNANYIVGLAVAPDGRLFVSTPRTISYLSPDLSSETMLDNDIYGSFLLGFDAISPLFFDRDGMLWIGRDGHGVMRLDLSSGNRLIFDESQLNDGTVRAIAQDSDGTIWLGTEKGLSLIDPDTLGVTVIEQQFGNSQSLSDNAIYCITPDSAQNLWIGTYFGGINVAMRKNNGFAWTTPGYNQSSLSGKAVRRIIEPEEGKLWLATEDGGINILDLKDHTISKFTAIPNLGSNVHSLYFDEDNRQMWIGTFRNGLFCYNMDSGNVRHFTAFNSGLRSNAVFAIDKQRNSDCRLWIATTAGLAFYNPATNNIEAFDHYILHHDFVYCLYPDSRGNLWVGSVNSGLFRISASMSDVKGWPGEPDTRGNGLKDRFITTICEDRNHRIFVGSNNGGIQIIDSRTLKFCDFPEDMSVYGTMCNIMTDRNGSVWITTSGGLFKVDPTDLSFTRFSNVDGLPENQFNFASGHLASDSNIYCGTVNGMVSFRPDLTKTAAPEAKVHLWSLHLNNKLVSPQTENSPLQSTIDTSDLLELDFSDSRVITINFGIISPASARSARYQVFIEGLDSEWRDIGDQRSVTLMEIPNGKYSFKVRALLSGSDWSSAPIHSLDMSIAPPMYRSSMALLLYTFLALGLCYGAYRLVNWRIRERQHSRLLEIERNKTDELNREKMEFFTNISHELKTPLSLILAPLKHLSTDQPMSDESRQRLSTAIANTSKMVDLINELVTFNRVESGNFQFYLSKGNPLTLIETLAGYFTGPASEKSLTLNVLTRNNGEDVWFSTTYLERIVSNLLSNAIKYTDNNGTIDVRAEIIEGSDNAVYLQLQVQDNGIGIAPEEIDNIFRKYYQTKRGYNASKSGWGIGLATVKKLVDTHKGTITVSSQMGGGSCFTVTINVDPDAFDPSCRISGDSARQQEIQPSIISNSLAVYRQPENSSTTNSDSGRTSILLVEDNPQLLRFLCDEFSKEYNVYTAANGVEALKITDQYSIDIVVSDVMMPEMDGIELCNALKTNLNTSHIPVILLTAKTDEESTVAGFQSGAEAYVAKPFDPQLLALRVKNILRARRAYINAKIDDASDTDREITEELPPLNKFDNEFIERINDMVNRNMDNSDFSIADITRELGISRSLLHIKMKTFFNASMTDYIKKCRMECASDLLKQGYNVSETAYRTGFSDPNYFSKVFKRTFGMPPTEYVSSRPQQSRN